MQEMILCKLGEVVLKGLNRRSFEMKLMSNIRRRTQRFGKFRIYSRQSTIYVEPCEESCDLEGAYDACKKVFGIIAITRALPCEKSKEAIQVSQWVGGELHDAFPHLRVDVHHPELTVYVEIREDAAYVHAPAESAAGGLPLGMGGHAVSLLSGGIDSPVSSYMIAKRGVQLEMIHFASPPYTSDLAREKVLRLAQELTDWCGRLSVFIIPFTEIQEEIRRNCPEEYFTLIMRRFMMRLANELALELRCRALVTGENLGQVASQTMQALAVSEDVTTMPVLRPLIGLDKEEIVKISRRIGTFETSILPYEDCCTVFTPRHPKTKPEVAEVREIESALDVEGLCRRAMADREMIRLRPQN